jgi:hypothetical protein
MTGTGGLSKNWQPTRANWYGLFDYSIALKLYFYIYGINAAGDYMEDHYVRLTLQEVARSDRWVMGTLL